MSTEIPLICNMGVFTPAQREAHVRNTTLLIEAVQGIHEVENGYEFTFPSEAELISNVAEFISNERLCCPFLRFVLRASSNGEPIYLSLTGPIGTQEFLREEFNGAFQ